jgi:hypothetical protein
MDDVAQLANLEEAAGIYLDRDSRQVEEIAHRLVASSFYFEKDRRGSVRLDDNGYYICRGLIQIPFHQYLLEHG